LLLGPLPNINAANGKQTHFPKDAKRQLIGSAFVGEHSQIQYVVMWLNAQGNVSCFLHHLLQPGRPEDGF